MFFFRLKIIIFICIFFTTESFAQTMFEKKNSFILIKGGEFIVGKFEDTLPKFFGQKRPLASIINFDADLYSSTLCALNNAKEVIDKNSILIFDEFLINDHWEKDEYKALNDFCNNLNIEYDVVAISFYSKQVAVKLKK